MYNPLKINVPIIRKVLIEKTSYFLDKERNYLLCFGKEEFMVKFLKKPKPIIERPVINEEYQTTFRITWEDVVILIKEDLTLFSENVGFKDWLIGSFQHQSGSAKNIEFKSVELENIVSFEMIGCIVSNISYKNFYPEITLKFNNIKVLSE